MYLEVMGTTLDHKWGHPFNDVDIGDNREERWENLVWADIAEPLRKAYVWTFQIHELVSLFNSQSTSELLFLFFVTERSLTSTRAFSPWNYVSVLGMGPMVEACPPNARWY